jgi:hypothetical protein
MKTKVINWVANWVCIDGRWQWDKTDGWGLVDLVPDSTVPISFHDCLWLWYEHLPPECFRQLNGEFKKPIFDDGTVSHNTRGDHFLPPWRSHNRFTGYFIDDFGDTHFNPRFDTEETYSEEWWAYDFKKLVKRG